MKREEEREKEIIIFVMAYAPLFDVKRCIRHKSKS